MRPVNASTFLCLFLLSTLVILAQERCPRMFVSGPAGDTMAGDSMIFTVNIDVADLDKLGYKWTVSEGKIENGQGKPWLYVRTDKEGRAENVAATVEVTGLPERCPNKSAQIGAIKYGGDPPLFTELEVFYGQKFRNELDAVAKQLAQRPGWLLYAISYSAPRENESNLVRREKLIKEYLTKTHKIHPDRIVFIRGGERSRYVRFYGIPPARK